MHVPFYFASKIELLVNFITYMASTSQVEVLGESVPTTSVTGNLVSWFLTRYGLFGPHGGEILMKEKIRTRIS